MTSYELARCVPMFALLGWAAAEDLRARRIPNWLTLALVLGGIARSFLPGSGVTPGEAAAGFGAGFGLMLIRFAINAVGGGDVKLMAGIGAWLGPDMVLKVFVVEAIIAMVVVVAQAARRGRMAALARNSAVVAMNLAMGDVGGETAAAQPAAGERLLPFAVPTLAAVVVVVAANWVGKGGWPW